MDSTNKQASSAHLRGFLDWPWIVHICCAKMLTLDVDPRCWPLMLPLDVAPRCCPLWFQGWLNWFEEGIVQFCGKRLLSANINSICLQKKKPSSLPLWPIVRHGFFLCAYLFIESTLCNGCWPHDLRFGHHKNIQSTTPRETTSYDNFKSLMWSQKLAEN